MLYFFKKPNFIRHFLKPPLSQQQPKQKQKIKIKILRQTHPKCVRFCLRENIEVRKCRKEWKNLGNFDLIGSLNCVWEREREKERENFNNISSLQDIQGNIWQEKVCSCVVALIKNSRSMFNPKSIEFRDFSLVDIFFRLHGRKVYIKNNRGNYIPLPWGLNKWHSTLNLKEKNTSPLDIQLIKLC